MAFCRSLAQKMVMSPPPRTITANTAHSADIINGKLIAKEIRSNVAREIRRMKASIGKCPGLGVVFVGEREDSKSFIGLKLKGCNEVGISSFVQELGGDCSEEQVVGVVKSLNENHDVHGVLVQLPLPQHLDEEKIVEFVSPEKDVDGFHPLNIGNLAMGRDPLFIPCAPKACVELLLRQGVELTGKRVAVIGKSRITGLPTSLLLQRHLATVSTVDVFTENPEQITCQADIVISDIGIPNFVRGHWLKPGALVIDMGANPVKDPSSVHGFRVTGDVCYEEAIKVAAAITPVPGGVGPVTISMLLSSTLDAAKRAFKFT